MTLFSWNWLDTMAIFTPASLKMYSICLAVIVGIQRHVHRAEGDDRLIADDPFRPVLGDDRNTVAPFDPECRQTDRQRSRPSSAVRCRRSLCTTPSDLYISTGRESWANFAVSFWNISGIVGILPQLP